MSGPLKFMTSRKSPRASQSSPFYVILVNSHVSFELRLFPIQKCRGNLPGWRKNDVLMAYFRTCALKKRGEVVMQVGILVDLYSVLLLSIDGYKTFEHLEDSTFP